MHNFYALILAGGRGTRLWPLSQHDHPKALLALFGERTLFQETVDRLDGLIPPERIFVVARPDLCNQLRQQAPLIPLDNFVHEPGEKDSGPALALSALHIIRRDPSAVLAVLSVDHMIDDGARLRSVLISAYTLATQSWIVTLGIRPDHPNTRFGYMERGDRFEHPASGSVYHVQSFVEKPDRQTAEQFIRSGRYAWDSGMLILSADRAIAEFERHQSAMMVHLKHGTTAAWDAIHPISLDFAILQTASDVLMIDLDLEWHDVGSWDTVYEILAQRQLNGNHNIAAPDHILIDTRRTLINSQRKVIAIGLEDLIVVDTDTELLLCRRGCTESIRGAVQRLEHEQKLGNKNGRGGESV